MFAEHPYEDVLMEEVAQQAGVSRALLYRHFPSKHALFAAVYQEAADRLLAETRLDPADSLLEQLNQGMDVHLDYFVANRHAVLAANRVLAGDQVIQTIMNGELDSLRAHLLVGLPIVDAATREAVSGVLKSWLVFVQTLVVDWLTKETCTRDQLRDVCVGAVLGALGPLLPTEPALGESASGGSAPGGSAPGGSTPGGSTPGLSGTP